MRPLMFALLAALSTGCATTQAAHQRPGEAASPSPTVDLEALMARELPAQPLQALRHDSKATGFTAKIEGSAAPSFQKLESGLDAFTVEFGPESAIFCVLQPEGIDSASAIASTMASLPDTIRRQAIRPVEVSALGGAPAMFVELDYLVDTEDGSTALGQLKLMTWQHPQLSLICNHDEVGYRESFRRVMKGFLSSLRFDGKPDREPRYLEIQAIRVEELPIGFTQRKLYRREDGLELSESTTSLLLLSSPTQLEGFDTIALEWTDERGEIALAKYVKAMNGELVGNLNLSRDGATHALSGTWDGKPFEAKFERKEGIPGDVSHWKALREDLLSRKKSDVTLASYSPESDPNVPIAITYRRTSGSERAVTVETGTMKANGRLDERGVLDRTEVELGKVKLVNERIFVMGSPN